MSSIHIDQKYPECCALDVQTHIQETLGSPIKLPPTLAEKLEGAWANEAENDLLALFKLIKGVPYKEAVRDNSYNSENDLDSFFVWSVYVPENCGDWCWCRDAFVVIETGSGGDPRYCSYSAAQVFDLGDDCIGDTSFLEWRLGWWAEPINPEKYDDASLDPLNDRISTFYSSSPYYELENLLYARPVWIERLKCFVARFKDCSFPVKLRPIEPCY